ncbi:MAG: HAD family hydrolase, partial [Myxococcota bacterium]
LSAFHPPDGTEADSPLADELARFLREPDKPLVVVLARPVPRKNLPGQIEAFGANPELRKLANLVVIAGTRDDIDELPEPGGDVLGEVLVAIDRHDLWGHVAIPKQVAGDDIGLLYRLAALRRGIHVNAALTEPFGLTLIEAAASALPIVATNDGGPRDIIRNCKNGVLVDPLDEDDIGQGMLTLLTDDARWDDASRSGLEGVRRVYSWDAHARRYLQIIKEAHRQAKPIDEMPMPEPLRDRDRAIASDLDLNLLAHPQGLGELGRVLRANRNTAFIIVTGRTLESARRMLKPHNLPPPDVLITSGGARIDYRPDLTPDEAWDRHIDHGWQPRAIRRVLAEVPGLKRQSRRAQRRHKISYYIDLDVAPPVAEIEGMLQRAELPANVVLSFGQFLDVMPIRASKGLALRHAIAVLEIPLERVLAVGGSGADEDMMRGNTLAAVVQNRHGEELSQLEDIDRIYFTESPGARGILEAIEHYDFFGACREPDPAPEETEE